MLDEDRINAEAKKRWPAASKITIAERFAGKGFVEPAGDELEALGIGAAVWEPVTGNLQLIRDSATSPAASQLVDALLEARGELVDEAPAPAARRSGKRPAA